MSPARRLASACALSMLCSVILAPQARAHDGPPYPIFVDQQLGGWTLSIWADPDVGTGTLYYYVDPPEGRTASELDITVTSFPLEGGSGPVSGVHAIAERSEPFQQLGTLEFDRRGPWRTRFVFRTPSEQDQVLGELEYVLDVTPPGLGAFDLLLFACPFLVVGALWLRILLAQRAHDRKNSSPTIP